MESHNIMVEKYDFIPALSEGWWLQQSTVQQTSTVFLVFCVNTYCIKIEKPNRSHVGR